MRITSAACRTWRPWCADPIYATPLTLALVEPKLREHGLADSQTLVPVRPRDRVTVGPFTIEFIRVTHSMPDCVALAIHTPIGVIVHTGDFKIDQTPIDGEHFDIHRFAQLGAEGVLALFADSTNIDRRGFTGSETEVTEAFEEVFTSAGGRLIVAAFASSIYRMQIVVDLAAQFDRKVAFVGRGMIENSQIAQRLGYLRIPAGLQIRDSEVMNYPAQDVLCLCTGSQGEPMSALSRIAIDDHRLREDRPRRHGGPVGARDSRERKGHRPRRSITSPAAARTSFTRASSTCTSRGTAARKSSSSCCRSSGPGISCRFTASTASSRSTRASRAGCSPAASLEPEILLAENGDIVQFDAAGARLAGKAPVGRVLIDGTRTGEVGDEVLRDRRHLAEDGLVVPVVAINRQTGALEGVPEIITRGFVMDGSPELLADGARVISDVVAQASVEERTDHGLIKEKLRVELRRFLRKRSGRRPFVLPVIMEILKVVKAIDCLTTRQRVHRRGAVRRRADLDGRARHLRADGPGVVLQRGTACRSRRTSRAASAHSWLSSRSNSSAMPLTCCRRASSSSAGTTSGAGRWRRGAPR